MPYLRHILMFSVALSLTGCASMRSSLIEMETKKQNCWQAQKAWNEWSWHYDDIDHPRDFGKGFKAGYLDVLNGGNGCQPTLPPESYWKPCYRSPEGRCQINDWFDGFSHGALAAQQDGAAEWGQVPISPTARLNLQMANASARPVASGSAMLPPPVTGVHSSATSEPLLSPDEDNLSLDDVKHLEQLDGHIIQPPPRPYE